jgi:NAD-dependent SIR2 family protein deacetylase
MSIMERWTADEVIEEIKDQWKAHFDGLAVVNSLSWRAESQGAGRFKVRIFGTVQCEQSDLDLFIEHLKKEIPCLAAAGAIQSKAKCVAPRASKTSKHKKAALPNYQKTKKKEKPKRSNSVAPWRKPAHDFESRVEEGEDVGEEEEEVEHGVPDDTTEVHEDPASISLKVQALAELVRGARHLVVYTGAGVSTAANIPDFRGPQGVWTLMDQGLEAEGIPLEAAVPTYTHMALVALQERGVLRHLVSQNVDGLHLRSGITKDNVHPPPPDPHTLTRFVVSLHSRTRTRTRSHTHTHDRTRTQLSELHGNCYVEICDSCGAEYFRDFDVVDNAGDEREPYDDHCTGRRCEKPDCYHGQLSTPP